MAWAAAASAFIASPKGCPVNLRFLIEGEEETGSQSLPAFLKQHRDRLDADVVVLSDTYNFATGVPALTWQLRGLVQVDVEVTCLGRPVHSGDFGGAVPDAVRILCRLLDELRGEDGRIAVPGLYADVVKPSAAVRRRLARLPFSEAAFRRGAGMLPGTRLERERGASVYEQLWTRPSLTVIAIEAHPLHGAANQVLDSARARISLRTVPNMDARAVGAAADPQAGREAAGRSQGRGAHHAHHALVDERPDRAGRRGGARRARARLRQEARAHRLRRLDRLRQAVRRRARRALPAHGRRGPRLRRALRGREPAPRRLEEVDALGRVPVRRDREARPRRTEAGVQARAASARPPQATPMTALLVVVQRLELDLGVGVERRAPCGRTRPWRRSGPWPARERGPRAARPSPPPAGSAG